MSYRTPPRLTRNALVRSSLAIGALAACRPKGDGAASQRVTLSGRLEIWSYTTQAIPESAIEGFHKEHPQVSVEQQQPAGEFRTEGFIVASAGGTPPGLMHLNLDFMPMYVEGGMLEPISRWVKQGLFGDTSPYLPAVVDAGIYKGEQYFLAHRQSVNTCVVNRDLFSRAGMAKPPSTWAEVNDIAQRLTRQSADMATSQLGLAITTSNSTLNSWFNPLLWQAGAELFAADGRTVTLGAEPAREALEFVVDLTARRKVAGEGTTAFTQGRVAMLWQWPQTSVLQLLQTAQWVDVGPVWTGKKRSGFGSLAGWVVPKAPTAELATRFLAFSLQPTYVRDFLAATAFLPVRRDIPIDYFGSDNVWWAQKFMDEARYMHYDILHPHVRQIMPLAAAELLKSVKGEVAPNAALQQAAHVCNSYLAERATK